MNAFISYSHQDNSMLDALHKHLVQLQRDKIIAAWTDHQILAGGEFDKKIEAALNASKLFLALLSPDYIASNYCYEIEFKTAQEKHESGEIIIVPIVIEPCDWQNTPFGRFKALPRDGKAISTWENRNTAFLDVIQNLRKLASSANPIDITPKGAVTGAALMSRNYKVKKDFDSIEKIEFIEKSFHEVVSYLKRYLEEIILLDNIKARTQDESTTTFEGLLVNRNKIATEATLNFIRSQENQSQNLNYFNVADGELSYTISTKANNRSTSPVSFKLSFDDYHLFWTKRNGYSNSRDTKEFDTKEIADEIWNAWLETVGIM
ncbi:toll/interleukin-1 receptor domain-containing protein [Spirosoma endophyticum]|uniref:TIR domain-containing protein n=1 Tax=Spirosoma endophyticum TaxID=662367 RepID=A0A1I2GPG8_9BACT|nr:toll/interleukin-1 receptor domain-containing protein [Spirosoma endophyticum]SFF18747.1 TIR domain-containing protein [Spirosoma endophyticum]